MTLGVLPTYPQVLPFLINCHGVCIHSNSDPRTERSPNASSQICQRKVTDCMTFKVHDIDITCQYNNRLHASYFIQPCVSQPCAYSLITIKNINCTKLSTFRTESNLCILLLGNHTSFRSCCLYYCCVTIYHLDPVVCTIAA